MAGLGAYLQEVSRAYFAQKGDAFAKLLSLEKSEGTMACGEALRPGSRVDIVQMCERQLQNPIDEVRGLLSPFPPVPVQLYMHKLS
eukprot:2764285-Pyramimonas_sp.AAC.2